MQRYALGIDIGTSSVKVTVCNSAGAIVASEQSEHQLSSPHPGWSEEDPRAWWNGTVLAVRKCIAKMGEESGKIEAIGSTGMLPAVVLLDKAGNVLRPSIQQNDNRASEIISELSIYGESFFSTTGASLSQQSIGPKLLWLCRNEREIYLRIHKILGSYDYINYILTGNINVEANWALESGLYDARQMCWSKDMISLFGIQSDMLPTVRKSQEIVGFLREDAAEELGLCPGIPVIAGVADHISAAFASGINQEGDVLIKFGSAGDILSYADKFTSSPYLYIDYHVIPGKYLVNGCMATSGSLLKWFVRQFCESDMQQAAISGRNVYALLDEKAMGIPPGSDGVIVLPYFLGEKTPILDPHAKGLFYGLTLSHTKYHLYRAIMEAVCFGFLHHIELLRKNNVQVRHIVMSEGGAASPMWRQIAADVIGIPVVWLKDNPGASYGAAFLAGLTCGFWDDWTQIDDFICEAGTVKPNKENFELYQKIYSNYKKLYPALKDIR